MPAMEVDAVNRDPSPPVNAVNVAIAATAATAGNAAALPANPATAGNAANAANAANAVSAGGGVSVLNLYPLENYAFAYKEVKIEKDFSVAERLARLRANYAKEGMRTSVEGVMLVHHHNHPHVLLIQVGASFFKLPGGRLRPGEDEKEGMRRKLSSKLGPTQDLGVPDPLWQVGEVAGVWWRPNFDNFLYPYCPPHITKCKELKKVFLIPLPEKEQFYVPRNLRIVAVPLFELYDNTQRYGAVIAALALQLSRFEFNLMPPSATLNE